MASIGLHELTRPDPLELGDYERLVGVLEDVVSAATPEQFRAQLPAALARHFNWSTARLSGGPTWEFPDAPGQFIRAMTGHSRDSRFTANPLSCSHLIQSPADHGLVIMRGPPRFTTLAARISYASAGALYVAVTFAKSWSGQGNRKSCVS